MTLSFIDGVVDADMARQIGTVMGRNHARSHVMFTNATLTEQYRSLFANKHHYERGATEMFSPVISRLTRPAGDSADDLAWGYIHHENRDGRVTEAVRHLLSAYSTKKESLVHGDLSGNNIMTSDGQDSDSDSVVKVVDFEEFSYGPTGVDLGR